MPAGNWRRLAASVLTNGKRFNLNLYGKKQLKVHDLSPFWSPAIFGAHGNFARHESALSRRNTLLPLASRVKLARYVMCFLTSDMLGFYHV